ncbi:MAG: TIGR03936 family radical SAM-associated protein [Oscillospiraceae bacterium]|nr:TIGR03936 family radical SAM-associated protein [Oscillospiraceae bacterium]
MKFISHLDLMRTMKSAMIRAKIPVLYSEGYNPRPKMVFTMPLSIGTESLCEFMDIKLTEPMDFELIKERLNVLDVYEPIYKLNEICYAEYKITFDEGIDIAQLTNPLVKSYSYENRILTAILSADSSNYLNPGNLAKILTQSGYDILKINNYLKDGYTIFK